MRQGPKAAVITAVAAAMLAAGGYGAYSLVGSGGSDKKPGAAPARHVVDEAPSADLAAAGEKDFLAAWTSGDLTAASKLTDDPAAALTALTAFKTNVKPSADTLTPGAPTTPTAFASATAGPSGAASAKPSAAASPSASAAASPSASASAAPAFQVPMTFKSHVEFAGTTNVWDYTGYLGMVKMSDGKAAVHWVPSVVHPHLGPGETITTTQIFNPPTKVTDRNGQSLAQFKSLDQIVLKFQSSTTAGDPADAGTGVVITDDAGKNKPEPLFTVVDPKPGKPFKLTIDAKLEAAAEQAVNEQYAKGQNKTPAGMVAIEPSTGNVLAIANAPATGQNLAFLGQTAPGSTMKIITATALLEAGIDPNATMPCPDHITTGTTYHNDFTGDQLNNTFTQDFTISCNTAFIKQGLTTLKSGDLAKVAADVYGVGPAWKTGITSADGQIPGPGQSKDETAGEFMGQGKITMNPLAMASIAATVESGTFKQPILVPGMTQIQAARQLSPDTLTKLRALMKSVVTDPSGTGTPVFQGQGITGTLIGGKTGTAETAPGATPNSWFTGYRDNLAVSAEVLGGNFGAQAAAPAVVEVLKVGNAG
ncbi:penicillin-binding transpeptidase domain-containing protein [Kitasatospora viridis]|uniref:Penicillin binding protein n=1 Tax=Kitasatospora viridis TaxID=281105 RepID=A0A561UFZ1_9ACTN|nr:penicillin-binding transpeptidase domain-containing protein [Kitasatospora viridis]TWF98266.1 penicillin binding protein [Kitasatospora viridis]